MENKEHGGLEKIIYSALGGFVILKLAPMYIPYVICYGGLMVSLYGILDVINKSSKRHDFDLNEYIENANKK